MFQYGCNLFYEQDWSVKRKWKKYICFVSIYNMFYERNIVLSRMFYLFIEVKKQITINLANTWTFSLVQIYFFLNIIIDLGISALLLFTWIGSIKVICHSAIYSVQGTGRHWWTYSRLWGQTSCNAGYRFVPVFLIFRSLFKVPLSRFTSLFYSLVCFIYLNRFTLLFVS